jgi:uncharacterized phage protein (TIGR02220 family)
MSKRFTSTEKWDKLWFQELPPRLKCFWQYITERCDVAGVWEINYRLASFLIGEDVSEGDLTAFGERVELLGDDKLWVKEYVKFQQTTLSRKCPAQKPVFLLLEKHGLLGKIPQNIIKDTDRVTVRVTDRVTDSVGLGSPKPTSNSNRNSNSNSNSNKANKTKKGVSEIIAHLNAVTGSSFTCSPTASASIGARLSEAGVTVDGIKEMIDAKAEEWGSDSKMQLFLRPKTLFGPENFGNYYGQKAKAKTKPKVYSAGGAKMEVIRP